MNVSSAVVLAGGEGERLRPLTKYRPKPMLPVANRPILERVLDAVIDAGIDDLHLVVGYRSARIQDHFGSEYRGRAITYHHQEKRLGSGHALLQARDAIGADCLVVNGDQIVTERMVTDVLGAHGTGSTATLAVVETDRATEYGAIRLDDDRVTELVERPITDDYRLLNAGIYAVGPSVFAAIDDADRTNGELALPTVLGDLVDEGAAIDGVVTEGTWEDATYPWDLLRVSTALLSQGAVDEPERDPGCYVNGRANVHDDATLRPPVVVGPEATIGPQAVVGPDAAVGENATIEGGAVVADAIVDTDARIDANATVRDSILGQRSNVGAGGTLPGGPGDVRIGTTVYENQSLGSVLADEATLGPNVSVAAGTLVGPKAHVGAGSHVTTNVGEGTEVSR